MNAPAAAGIAHAFEHLPVKSILPSSTQAQARRRARFDPKAMAELVESIFQVGVMQPVVVIPVGDPTVEQTYELVAGERRWQAAQTAGLATIPAVISNIGRGEIVQFQVIENKQRESLHPLDEADAFQELIDTQKISPEQVAERIGLSRSHVYNRLKLLKVAPAVQQALEAGAIHHSAALRIARIPGKKLQEKALKFAAQKDYRGERPSDRMLGLWLQSEFMVRLDGVVFDLTDVRLNPQRGACAGCPHNSANDPELQAEIVAEHGEGAHVCTDKPCHDAKAIEHFNLRRAAVLERGGKVIEGDEAKKVKPNRYGGLCGYVDLDAPLYEDDEGRTPRQILAKDLAGKKAPDSTLFVDPHDGKQLEILDEETAAKLLKKHGVEIVADTQEASEDPAEAESRQAREAEERAKQAERRELEMATRKRVLELVLAKWKGPLKKPELSAIAIRIYENGDAQEALEAEYGGKDPQIEKMNEAALGKLLVLLLLGDVTEHEHLNPGHLYDLAKRLKIDPVRARKDVKATLTGSGAAPKIKGKKK